MIRTVVSIALFILLVIGCVWIYRIVTHESVPGSGEVVVRSSPDHDQMETGTTYIGDKPIEARPAPSRSDVPGTINTEPVANYNKMPDGTPANSSVDTTQYDLNGRPTNTGALKYGNQSTDTMYSNQATPTTNSSKGGWSPYTPTSLSTDTIAPNPPNGLAFAGTGPYQWYRQGDLTWRVDSKSGASCIDYATMEEWSKPIVYSHGCGSRGHWHRRHLRD